MMRRVIMALVGAMLSSVVWGGNTVLYEIEGTTYEGYYVTPRAGAPLVLLVHDWDGLTNYEIRRAEMLAEAGYAVFAADLFGAGVRPPQGAGRDPQTGELYQEPEQIRTLLKGALNAARAQGANVGNAVAAGYSFGGAAVLELARSGAPLKGFAVFHGSLRTPAGQSYGSIQAPLLVMHGSADPANTLDDFAALGGELESAGVAHELVSYGGAPDAFTVFGSDRYREDADRQSWQHFNRFLAQRLN